MSEIKMPLRHVENPKQFSEMFEELNAFANMAFAGEADVTTLDIDQQKARMDLLLLCEKIAHEHAREIWEEQEDRAFYGEATP